MRTAAKNGIKQLVLEAGREIQFRGVTAEKHHLYFGIRIGIDQSQLEAVQLFLIIVHQTYLKSFSANRHIKGSKLHAGQTYRL